MPSELPSDRLAPIVSPDTQRLAARMAQDGFATLFRLTVDGDAQRVAAALADLETRGRNWCAAGHSAEATALRAALLISGLDQWGLAYSQAFGLTAIPALSALLGALRRLADEPNLHWNPRVARSANLVFALFAFVFYYNLLSLGQNAIANGQFSFGQLMVLLHGSIFVLAMLILAKRHHNLQWREMPGLLFGHRKAGRS